MACANVGSLILVRASRRTKELAIRRALGGSRSRIVRQFLAESSLLAVAAGLLGVGLARVLIALAVPFLGDELYRVGEVEVDGSALGFTVVVSLLASLLCGVAPAIQATGRSPLEGLGGGHGRALGSRQALRSVLVASQVAIAVLLLVGSALMTQSFLRLLQTDPGFDPNNVLTLEIELPITRYPTARDHERFYDEVLDRMRNLPGVIAAASVDPLPLNFESERQTFQIPGRPAGARNPSAARFLVSPGYFAAMNMPLLRGRDFTESDDDRAPAVIVINRRMAERYWPNEDPVGKTIVRPGRSDRMQTIIGVVGDSKHLLINEEPASLLYVPQRQLAPRNRFLVVRTDRDPLDHVTAARNVVQSIDAAAPMMSIRTMEQVVSESLTVWTGATGTLSAFGAGALLLATLGIFGVVSHSVGERAHEIATRTAMGAEPKDILTLVPRHGTILVGFGTLVGLAAAAALASMMESLLYGVAVLDPRSFVSAPLLLGAAALAAAYYPARRASRANVASLLRGI